MINNVSHTVRALAVVAGLALLSAGGAHAAAGHDGHHAEGHNDGGHNASGHHDAGHHGAGGAHASMIGRPGRAADVGRRVEVLLDDNFFSLDGLHVEPGETIQFIVRNVGSLVHEFNIGTAAMHQTHQAEMQSMMASGSLMPDQVDLHSGHGMQHDDPNSVLLEPGESAELIWQFPASGELQFACNVPGHYQAGMHGDFHLGH